MALLGAVLLVVVLLIRPQEFITALQPFQLLYVTTGLAALGILAEFGMGKQKSAWSPQLPWLLGFLVWAFICTIARLGVSSGFKQTFDSVGLSTIFMLVVTYSARSFVRFRTLAVVILLVGTAISAVCIHMAQQDAYCIVLDHSQSEGEKSEGESDGRTCDTSWICEREGDPHKSYICEKAGLFGTFTQGRRVRWRGTLGDPNELAVLIGATIPFLFALGQIVKKVWFTIAMFALLAIALYCVMLSGSRGGQLVVLTVFAVYFVRRYGLKGLVVGGIFALPVLMLGGRDGEEADSSSEERAQLLYMGMDMIKSYQPFGVGVGDFKEHSFNDLTAHNSYVLAAAEMGIIGSILWTMLVYVSMKIPWMIARRPPPELDPRVPPFAYALFVSFAGILVGIFFLSFCYKQMLFIYFGLAGALYGVVKKVSPSFNVKVSMKELVRIVVLDVVVLVAIFVYSRIKGQG